MSQRRNNAAVSNEEIIAALISSGTIQNAAQAAGIAPRTIYDRMKDKEFREEYKEARADVLRGAVNSLNQRVNEAVNTIAEIMGNEQTNPATRLQAAQAILTNAGKFCDRLAEAEKTAQAERDALL